MKSGVFLDVILTISLVSKHTFGQKPAVYGSSSVEIGENTFRINCRLNVFGLENISTSQYVTQILLERSSKFTGGTTVNTFETYREIVRVDFDTNSDAKTVTWSDESIQNRARVGTGNKIINETMLRLTIFRDSVDCTEEGFYRCTFYGPSFVDSEGVKVDSIMATRYSSVTAAPWGFTDIIAKPYNRYTLAVSSNASSSTIYDMCLSTVSPSDTFRPGTSLVINCTAVVGYPPQPIKWCRKRPRDADFADFEYNTILTQRADEQLPMSCILTKTSLLLYDVTSVEDDGTEFLCQIGDVEECGGQMTSYIGIRVSSTIPAANLTEFDECVAERRESESVSIKDTLTAQQASDGGMATIIIGIALLAISVGVLGVIGRTYYKTRNLQKEMAIEKERAKYQTLSFNRSSAEVITYEAVNENSGRNSAHTMAFDNDGIYSVAK